MKYILVSTYGAKKGFCLNYAKLPVEIWRVTLFQFSISSITWLTVRKQYWCSLLQCKKNGKNWRHNALKGVWASIVVWFNIMRMTVTTVIIMVGHFIFWNDLIVGIVVTWLCVIIWSIVVLWDRSVFQWDIMSYYFSL